MAIINCSRWPITKPVTVNTKTELVQTLLVEELLNKRLDNIRAMKRGLSVLGFVDMCQTNISLTASLFLYTPKEFRAVDFLNLVSKQPPLSQKQQNAYRWFVNYIQERETVPTAVSLEEQGIYKLHESIANLIFHSYFIITYRSHRIIATYLAVCNGTYQCTPSRCQDILFARWTTP